MKLETFSAGRWQQRFQYKSFEPVLVDHEWTWEDAAINTLLEKANRVNSVPARTGSAAPT